MTLLELIRAAIKEDMPRGDLTTESLGLAPRYGAAKLIAKQDIVLSGSTAFEQTILSLEHNAKIKWHFEEGDEIFDRQTICTIQGDLIQILKAERVALNFLGHLSGISTLTSQFVKQVSGTKTKILDTRKTLPGYRDLEKRAVVHGGGVNHRLNLSDAILLKDNHLTVMKSITTAVNETRKHSQLPIEVEVKNFQEVEEAVSLNVSRLLLDNMPNDILKKALSLVPDHIETEASGNMNLTRVKSVAELGVDFISVGALTHSAPCADVSLLFDWNP